MAILVYETTDNTFAERTLDAFAEAKIPSYRTGYGRSNIQAPMPGRRGESQVCIYIENRTDFRRANDILIGLGAVVEGPFRLPSGWAVHLAFLIAGALAIWIAFRSFTG